MARVRVVVPVHNHEEFCRDALQSILKQSYRDLELVAVDDGSTDQSLEVIRQVAGADPRVKVLSLPHGGIIPALNAGLEGFSGEFIARMDADDFSLPDRLARQVERLESRPGVGAVDCRVSLGRSGATGQGMEEYIEWLNSLSGSAQLRRELFIESPLVHPAVLMRTSAYLEAGGYMDDGGPEDYSLWLRMAAAGWDLDKVPEVLFHWRDLPGRLTRTDLRYSGEEFHQLKGRMIPQVHPRTREGVIIWGAGKEGKALARALVKQAVPIACFLEVDHKKLSRRILGAEVVHYSRLQDLPSLPVIVAIGVRRAREEVREEMARIGKVEGTDYFFAA